MSIYKRKETWWIQFTAPDGRRIQQTAGTQIKQEAQELHDRLKAEAWRVKNLGDKPRYTWQEAVIRWLTEQSHKKSIRDDKMHLRWLNQHLKSTKLDEINRAKIDAIKSAKLCEGVSNATVNRMLALIRSILNSAKNNWEWLETVPTVKLLPEPKKRLRWLTKEEARRLLTELPEHLEAMARFTLATGLRESNVTGLQWSQIDMLRRCAWIHADQAKAEKAIGVPLNDEALAIIQLQVGRHDMYVFTYEGKPVTRANNHAWRKALVRAGISDFRWHDLRHTWASWHVQNGTPLHVLKELGGWAELTMVLRYAHLSSKHLAEYAGNSTAIETNLLHEIKPPQIETPNLLN
ncbi:MAG: tyrosine-type recombinase/integrase [Methylosarcina sp.]|jgi:integrase